MNKLKSLTRYAFYTLLVVWATSCTDSRFKLLNQNKNVEKNDIYLYSHDWDAEDPFEKIEIYTVKVIDIKDGFVKWLPNHKDSRFYLSGPLKYFKHHIKPCN
mgnify:CR=1 FL=1